MEGSERQSNTAAKIVVAVKAERVISKSALAWALTHVVHPGDGITLLAIFPAEKTGNFAIPLKRNYECKFVLTSLLISFHFLRWNWSSIADELICVLRKEILEHTVLRRRLCGRSTGRVTGSNLPDLRVVFSNGASAPQPHRGDSFRNYEITTYRPSFSTDSLLSRLFIREWNDVVSVGLMIRQNHVVLPCILSLWPGIICWTEFFFD